jgi:hypothetical protein
METYSEKVLEINMFSTNLSNVTLDLAVGTALGALYYLYNIFLKI